MSIRFKCPHCKKSLVVKDHLAGKRATCPVCKKPVPIPDLVAPPTDLEDFAAAAMSERPAVEQPTETAAPKIIQFNCPFCDEKQSVSAELSGKQTPCADCKRIVKVPLVKVEKPKDWRELIKKGPTAAIVNQPEQLEGTWDAGYKTRVSQQALIEAEAIPEAAVAPIGLLGWLKRGALTTLVVSALFLGYVGISKMRTTRRAKDDVAEATKVLDAKPAAGELHPLTRAELNRALGELRLRQGKVKEAREYFNKCRAAIPASLETVAFHERDLILSSLALLQVDLGGTQAEQIDLGRITWGDALKDLQQTLGAMTPDGQAAVLRELSSKLIAKNKLEIAITLASTLASTAGEHSPLMACQQSLLISNKDAVKGAKLPPRPGPDQPIADGMVRLAYVEGLARLGEYRQALEMAKAPGGNSFHRIEAALAAAAVALADVKAQNSQAEAAPFVREAVAEAGQLDWKVEEARHWLLLHLVRIGARTSAAEEVKPFLDTITARYRPWAQLAWLTGKLERSKQEESADLLDKLGEPDSVVRGLGWEALTRHNARLGYAGAMRDILETVPEIQRPFLHMGLALGEQDAR